MAVREDVREQLPIDAIIFNNASYDNSIIGTTTDGRVVYCFEQMVKELSEEQNISIQEAVEWIETNTIRMLPYLNPAPVIMFEKVW